MGSRLSSGGGRGAIVDINITPFVDIVLVVLIIFMVTTTVIQSRKDIPITLPAAATGEPSPTELSLAVTIARDGSLSVDGTPTTLGGLGERVRSERAAGRDIVCLLGADESATHGSVVTVLDVLRLAGVVRFAFEIRSLTGAL